MNRLVAEFADAQRLLEAVRRARAAQLPVALDACSPYPVEGLAEALDIPRGWIAAWTLGGGLFGGCATFALECYSAIYDYPLDIGGRPLLSWPAFLPPALEVTLVGAACCGIAAFLIESGLPRFHHPLFELSSFEAASDFLLVLTPDGPRFDEAETRRFLEALSPVSIGVVAA